MSVAGVRNLVLVLGDQLDPDGAAFDGFDTSRDVVLMSEVLEEARYVMQHRQRLVLFFCAMRHMRDALRARGRIVLYGSLEGTRNTGTLSGELERTVRAKSPARIVLTEPGDHRVLEALKGVARRLQVPMEVRTDRHFLDTVDGFAAWAEGRSTLVLEHYYRHMRRRHDILMCDDAPVEGRWNFDADNRERPPPRLELPAPRRFRPDALTTRVMKMVERQFPDAPGSTAGFDHPVTREQAREALRDFVRHRLPWFGRYQDAMVGGQPWLAHSLLSSSLNLHLLDPREVLREALQAHASGDAPINAVEGFVRQILGWREYVRGVYWSRMPGYAELNALDAKLPMPAFFWDADTPMNCVRECVTQLVDHAYAHHIQRLMVLGQLAMLLGVRPYEVHRWHLSMYIDAVDWASLPNVLGMSQYADGGIVGSKPYCASGAYIRRMSNYCAGCRFDPAKATGDDACPFTTLYWDFLARNRQRLQGNRRMTLQLKNLQRKDAGEQRTIRRHADTLMRTFTARSAPY